MDMRKALAECLSERTLGLTPPELERIMEEELNKPEAEMDSELVALCVELLSEPDEHTSPKEEKAAPVSLSSAHKVLRPLRTMLVAAAMAVLLMASAIVVSAKVFQVDLVHYTLELFTGGVKIGTESDDADHSFANDLRAELAECDLCNFESAYLPESFLDGAVINEWSHRHYSTEISKVISFTAIKDGKKLQYSAYQYPSKDYLVSREIERMGEYVDAGEVQLDDISVLVVEYIGHCDVYFTDDCMEYLITSFMSAEDTLEWVSNMKKG